MNDLENQETRIICVEEEEKANISYLHVYRQKKIKSEQITDDEKALDKAFDLF